MRGNGSVRLLSPELGWTLPIESGGLRYEAMTAAVLAESGDAVILVPRDRSPGLPPAPLVQIRLLLSRWPLAAAIFVAPSLVGAVGRLQPRVLRISSIAYFWPAALVAAWAIRRLGRDVSLVAHVHHVETDGGVDSARGRVGRFIDRAVLCRCDRVTVPSDATAAAVAHMLKSPDVPVAVIPPGLPLPATDSSHDFAIESRPLRLLFVGRLKPRKRPLDFAHACVVVARARPVEVIVVGRGQLDAQMRAILAGIRVSFLRSHPDLSGLYQWADVLVCTSAVEGFYFVGLEAFMFGTAMVSYDIPAIRELTVGGSCAGLVPFGNVAALADAIIGLASQDLERLSAAGRDRASDYSEGRFRAAVTAAFFAPQRAGAEGGG